MVLLPAGSAETTSATSSAVDGLASATAIGWSDYLNNFLLNAFHLQIPIELRSPISMGVRPLAIG